MVVLLDGEGAFFKDELLQLGEEGGRSAANQLYSGLDSCLLKHLPSLNSPKIMIKIYLNVRAFGESCVRGGIISDPTTLQDFIRGFNETISYSEIVDIGCGKNKASDKIQGKLEPLFLLSFLMRGSHELMLIVSLAETFQVFLYNCHCHHILFGCASNS